jgi:hypothetical protein
MNVWARETVAVIVRAFVITVSDIDLKGNQFSSGDCETLMSNSPHTGAASRSCDRSHLASRSRNRRHD